jgi:predicted outer membrane repeat protein
MSTCRTIVSSCSFQDNMSAYGGALYLYGGTPGLVNCTMFSNQSTTSGGAICLTSCKARIVNTIFWDNLLGGDFSDIDLYSTSDSLFLLNNTLRQGCPTGALTICTTAVLADPLLSPLAGNGGEVLTIALGAGSPALNVGVYVYRDTDGMLCYNEDGGTAYKRVEDSAAYTPKGSLTRINGVDARGVARPQGSGIDLGAFELE